MGKTVLLTELINNIVIKGGYPKRKKKEVVSVFCAVGERLREAQELYENLQKAQVLSKTALIVGQMGENPAIRFKTAAAGVALAEFFRDEEGKDILFFVDNVFRFAQAGYELSTLIKSIPSEDGYQATLTSEMGSFHERLSSTLQNSMTAIEAIYVQSDDINDYVVRSIFPYLDTVIVLSRSLYQQGILPAIDILSSTSAALDPEIIGKEHYQVYLEAKTLLEKAVALDRIVSLVGIGELSAENQKIYLRSIILKNYMTQNFFVIEDQSGRKGQHVSLKEAVSDVKAILEGKYDAVPAEQFLYIATANFPQTPSTSV